ncbi:phage tail length tape measure family protein [Pedomonas sp. V897]|uniref:phage tail length tape measure family protein n=1 Tax=Pedomonas sp. V897 TaxID=3446482 RepID=UPI003EE070EA
MQVASLHTSIVLESASFLVPLRDVTSEVEKSSRKMEQEQNRLARSADRLLSSLDPVYAAQSRFSKGMEEADRLLKAGAISVEQHARAVQALKANLDSAVSVASKTAAAEQERLAASADRLLSSVDPLYAAQSRFNKELAEARQLFQQGAISAQQFATVESALKLRLEQTSAALRAHDLASAQSQQRMRLLGYQISDVGAQLVGGQNPFMILAQQGPQVAMAFDGAKGAAGRFASFMTGPWGAAILAATSAVGMLWMKLAEGKTATEEHANASKTLRQAIEDLDRATGIYNQTLGKKIRLEEEEAREKYDDAVKERAKAIKTLADARKRLADATSGSIADPSMAASAAEAGLVVQKLEKKIADLNKEIGTAEEGFRRADVARSIQRIREELDPTAAAIGRFDRAVEALAEKRAKELITQEQFDREYKALEIKKEAELEAIKATEKASKAQDKAAKEWEKASNSRIQSLLKERTAMAQYVKDMKILQESLSRGTISAMERDIAANRARQEWLDGLALKRLEPKIMDSSAAKLALPKVNMRELANLDSVRATREEIERTAERYRQLDQAAMQFATNMSSSFEDAIFAGKGLRSVLSGLLDDLGKMVIRLTVIEPLARSVADALKGSRLGGGGGIFGLIGGLFGGARANGGPVTAGRAYLVGERGPELLMPATSGTIIPNGALQGMTGGGRVINITVNAQDAVLASTVKGWIVESMHAATAAGSADAQASIARHGRRRLPL